MKRCRVRAEGHLIDTGLMSRFFGAVIEGGGTYEILRFEVGRTKRDFTVAVLEVAAKSEAKLAHVLDNLVALGCRLLDEREITLQKVPRNGVAPESFYSTTHHRTRVQHAGRWIDVKGQRMDGMIVVRNGRARCVLMRDLKRGDPVVCGVRGVQTFPPFETRQARSFSFMRSETSSERAVALKAREVARLMRQVRREGRRVVAVPGPVVVHTGGAQHLTRLIRRGWIDVLLSGNALAVHDVELARYGSSLGIDLKTGVPAAEGHMHHLRAINDIRRAGSLARAVKAGVLTSGIMHQCIQGRVPFVLAGSIRDDGPLPDTEMDLVRAQERYAALLKDAGLVLVLASMLHGIGVGNMSASEVILVCVDIHAGVVTKLADRGSAQTLGIVTDVSAFLHQLDRHLRGRAPQAGSSARKASRRPTSRA